MTGRSRRWRKGLLLSLLALLIATPASALLVRPVLLHLTSSGGQASGAFEVINDRNRPVAVEIKVNTLTLPERGEAVITPDAGDDFAIYPPIANIPAGGRQVFRVRWVGDTAPETGKMYMFSTSELPVSDQPGRTQLQVLYAINSVVSVRAPQARPAVTVAGVERATNAQGVAGVYVTFENSGAAMGQVANSELELTSGSWSKRVGQADLNNVIGLGIVPPRQRRAMFVPVADLPATGPVSARLRAFEG